MAEVINVVALVKVKEEHIKDAEPIVKELAEASRKEEGVKRYEIYRVNEKKGVYVFLEQYASVAAFEAHKKSEHFIKGISAAKPFFVEDPVIVSLEKEEIWFANIYHLLLRHGKGLDYSSAIIKPEILFSYIGDSTFQVLLGKKQYWNAKTDNWTNW